MTKGIEPVKLFGITLEHPLMLAAGTSKTLENVRQVLGSAAAAVTVGSITKNPRDGNKGDVYYYNEKRGISLNAIGMSNLGIDVYEELIPRMIELGEASGKQIITNVAGFSPREFGELTRRVWQAGSNIVELNFGCPNIWEDGTQKRIFSFDPDILKETLRIVKEEGGNEVNIIAKLSPFTDPMLLKEIADVIIDSGIVDAIGTMNTLPNSLIFNTKGKSKITFGERKNNILAGGAGPSINAFAAGQIRQFRDRFRESGTELPIFGFGGVDDAETYHNLLEAGADVVGVNTAFQENGPKIIGEILAEYAEYSEEEGIEN